MCPLSLNNGKSRGTALSGPTPLIMVLRGGSFRKELPSPF